MEKSIKAQGSLKSAFFVVILGIFTIIINYMSAMFGADDGGVGELMVKLMHILAAIFLIITFFLLRLRRTSTVFFFIVAFLIILPVLLETMGTTIHAMGDTIGFWVHLNSLLFNICIIAFIVFCLIIKLRPEKSYIFLILLGLLVISVYAIQMIYELLKGDFDFNPYIVIASFAKLLIYILAFFVLTPFRKMNLLRKMITGDSNVPQLVTNECKRRDFFILGLSLGAFGLIVVALVVGFIKRGNVDEGYYYTMATALIFILPLTLITLIVFFKKGMFARKLCTTLATFVLALVIGMPSYMALRQAIYEASFLSSLFYLGANIQWFLTPLLLPLVYLLKTNRLQENKLATIYFWTMAGLSVVVGFFHFYRIVEVNNYGVVPGMGLVVSLALSLALGLAIVAYWLVFQSTKFEEFIEIELE